MLIVAITFGTIHHASLVVYCWLWWLMIPNVASSAFWCWWRWMIMPIIPSAVWWLREVMPHIMPAVSCWFDDEWSAHYTCALYLCVMILVMNDTATDTSASVQWWLWWWMIPHIIPVYLRDDSWGENLNHTPYRSCCVTMVVVLNDTTHHTSCISLQWSAINNLPT